jgi:glyoxylase-like metal-dependent hydrolase (beta-lactamase superfamily II)
MPVRLDIISIGTLSRNRLWQESAPTRTPHATTTLLRSRDTAGPRLILIDPGLPAPIQAARLNERTGLRPEQIDTIFLTNFRPAHRAGLAAYPNATLLIHERERDAVGDHLRALLERLEDDPDAQRTLRQELEILGRTRAAEDRLVPQVDLFPLPGYTPGTCGLLLSEATTTTLIAGDAVPTREHLLAAQILPDAVDVAAAQESMREAYEIADVIVPGHDNVFVNPRSW